MQVAAPKEKPKELAAVPVLKQETIGAQRIMIELEGDSRAAGYAQKYNKLVSTVVDILKDENIKTEEEFFTTVWGVMNSNFEIKYGVSENEFISESLDKNVWDCDNSSILVFDVAREMGIELEIAVVPKHAVIVGNKFYLETTAGKYFPVEKLPEHYPSVYWQSGEDSELLKLAYYTKANSYIKKGDYKKGIKTIKKVLKINPEDAYAHLIMGDIYYKSAFRSKHFKTLKYLKALKQYKKAAKAQPNSVELHYYIAMTYMRLTNITKSIITQKKAFKSMEKAIEADPHEGEAYVVLGDMHTDIGKKKEAAENYKKAFEMDPALLIEYYDDVERYIDKENFEMAVKTLTKLTSMNPTKNITSNAYIIIGNIYFMIGEHEKAVENYTEAIKIRPKEPAAYYLRALVYGELGEHEKAEADDKTWERLYEAKKKKKK